MDWFVVRHPQAGVGVVAETALHLHRGLGWMRVSEAIPDHAKDQVVTADYVDAPDLDADPPLAADPADESAAKTTKAAAKTTPKES